MSPDVASEYMPIAIFSLIAVIFAAVTLFAQRFFRPDSGNPMSTTTYECGEDPIGDARVEFSFQYYMFAIIFVAVDLLAVFLALFALNFREWGEAGDGALQQTAVGLIVLVTGILLGGVYYALRRQRRVVI